jgi:CRISPR/Cas system CMR-associated protein Cmr5 small subunit
MRPMDVTVIEEHLENIDRRLGRLEQILPTMASKEGLRAAIEPLATKRELRAAIAPLATKEELRHAIREEGETLRRHMTMLIEHHDSKLELLAEHVLSLGTKRMEE